MKTFMFTDIVGSTNLVVALGDEAWETMLAWHNTTAPRGVHAHGGEEISTTGDGFFVSFDSPDLASRPRSRSSDGPCRTSARRTEFAPQIRIGPARLRWRPRSAATSHGKALHEASRIAALGGGGDIDRQRRRTVGAAHATSEVTRA
jgi:class 3 adenylate cyclase